MKTVINSIVIEENKLLLVKKKETWILPGGKIEVGENDLECLSREISEELSNTKIKDVNFYKEFSGITPHSKKMIRAKTYFAKIDGELHNSSQEISDVRYVSNFKDYKISNITKNIIDSLIQDKYLI